MFKFVILLIFCLTACYGETTPKPVYCGETPKNILTCLRSPQILSTEVTSKCHDDKASECAVLTCAFREYKWFNGDKVDRTKLTSHFNQLAKDKPDWKAVIDYVIPTCLERDLPPQGVHLNCPAYDIMHCVLISFIQKSQGTLWSSSSECVYPRQYAGACAVCPSDCFATLVPYGSCNACYLVPNRPSA